MNTKSLCVLAQIKAKPGMEDKVREALQALVEPSRKDAGCLNYDLHQASDNAQNFLFHENWIDQAHLDQHLQTAHVKAALASLAQLVAEAPQITRWHRIK
jgi:quinol monooxygenase YgiN